MGTQRCCVFQNKITTGGLTHSQPPYPPPAWQCVCVFSHSLVPLICITLVVSSTHCRGQGWSPPARWGQSTDRPSGLQGSAYSHTLHLPAYLCVFSGLAVNHALTGHLLDVGMGVWSEQPGRRVQGRVDSSAFCGSNTNKDDSE